MFFFFVVGGGEGGSKRKEIDEFPFLKKLKMKFAFWDGRGSFPRVLFAQGKVGGSFPSGVFREYIYPVPVYRM